MFSLILIIIFFIILMLIHIPFLLLAILLSPRAPSECCPSRPLAFFRTSFRFMSSHTIPRFRMYCPDKHCQRHTRKPFSAASEDDLVEQILQHASSEDTIDHFVHVGKNKAHHEAIIRRYWQDKNGWRDDPSPSPAPERRRSRSPRSRSIPRRSSSDMNVYIDLANQAGELMEAATRLHQAMARLLQSHPNNSVYPRVG